MKLPLDPRNWLAAASLAAIAVGLWWERPSAALIVTGAVMFTALAWSHVTRKP